MLNFQLISYIDTEGNRETPEVLLGKYVIQVPFQGKRIVNNGYTFNQARVTLKGQTNHWPKVNVNLCPPRSP